ncbi:AAA family ATPase [Ruficoccus sp. ZRK36]|uniref:AAA family ATPase n=1 Tax=Ruficoccus sp. ZRK36 TaxID=2866311 RepID=UPI001C72A609|nr:AAA family ATPase [Ruficoccus sp. ZRK36]QYY34579.1 AAA family ATPase [Ruficoccus sp. ZRK36]
MAFRYTSKGIPEVPDDFRQVAEDVVGPVDWTDEHSGYCQCPGAHKHTTPSRERDCRVYLDAENGYAPTIHCFHDSCKEEIAAANFALRSTIGKAAFRAGDHHDFSRRQNGFDSGKDPFESFLKACFKADDILSLAPGTLPDGETRAIPEHGGINVFTRDEWLERAAAKGGIERLFSTRHGLYIRINPVSPKSNGTDKDVTAFRHTLIESDRIPKAEQERILRNSGLPIAALIDSGGHSIHAWVRVEAKTRDEYHARRERLWQSLPEGFVIDSQNRNPSRFSRCPGGRRGDAVQRLLAVNLGPSSFEAWESEGDGLGLAEPLRVSQLGDYDTGNDPNNVLGNRWLCRGGSLIIVGQSGIGKSSFSMQLAVMWALGLPVFNIRPVRPLKSLIIQAENDIGDLAEMYQGVRIGMGLNDDHRPLLEENIIFYRDTIHSGADFAKTADVLIQRHKPDLVWGDPLLNYIGDDASQQKVISEFCGRQLNPISERTGIIWCFMHHTGKPPSDSKARSHWTGSDYAYSGLGSSALTNWAREVAVLMRAKTPDGQPPTFRFELCKRRRRAGMTDTQGNSTEAIFVRHGQTGICWRQCPEPQQNESGSKYSIGKQSPRGGRPKAIENTLVEFERLRELTREWEAELSAKYEISASTVRRRWREYQQAQGKGQG